MKPSTGETALFTRTAQSPASWRRRRFGGIAVLVHLAAATLPPGSSIQAEGPTGSDRASVPSWAAEARWYLVDVLCFHADPAAKERGDAGDLAGLRSKLEHIAALGFNAIYVTGALEPLLMRSSQTGLHVKPDVHVPGSEPSVRADLSDDLNPADRHLLSLVEEAHKQGLRVVIRASLETWQLPEAFDGRDAAGLISATSPFLDPNGDGDPRDGVDGWSWVGAGKLPAVLWTEWCGAMKRLNPDALLIGDVLDFEGPEAESIIPVFDAGIDDETGDGARRLLIDRDANYTRDSFWRDLTRAGPRKDGGRRAASPLSTAGLRIRSWGQSIVARPPDTTNEAETRDAARDGSSDSPEVLSARRRLALAVLFLVDRPPLLEYGQEFGVFGGEDALGCNPMPRPEAPGLQGTDPPSNNEGGDFRQLIHLLNAQRGEREALSRGALRVFQAPLPDHVLAFSRTLGASEILVVVNHGDRAERVVLPLGRPKQLVGILTPQLAAPPRPPPRSGRAAPPSRLLVTGARQSTDAWGDLDLVLEPLSVRLVLVNGS